MKIVTRKTAREIDRRTIEEFGVPSMVLMENAGRAVARVVMDEYPSAEKIAVVCGGGNNAGDGFVAARHLTSAGKNASVYLAEKRRKYKGDSKTNLEALFTAGTNVRELEGRLPRAKDADVIVDAVFGTGLDRDVSGFYEKLVKFMNGSGKPVVSADLPSGLDSDTGKPLGAAVRADVTVTFAHAKLGMCLHPGVGLSGKIYVANITTPGDLERDVRHELVTFGECAELIGKRDPDSHKGTFGHLLVLAGSPGKSGAAVLCADAALRSGSGLVTLGVPRSVAHAVEEKTTEVMSVSLADSEDGTFGEQAGEEAIKHLENGKTAIAVGPGISTSRGAGELVRTLVSECAVPMVFDADALNVISQDPGILTKAKAPVIVTPHPGEMARLCGSDTKRVQDDRVGTAAGFSEKYGCHTILKGARTVTATAEGKVFINPTGNPGMASGGTGDVLTGVVAGLVAQGYDCAEACVLGVFLHGHAADLVLEETGTFGFTASEISDKLPASVNSVLSATEEKFFRTIL